MILSDLKYSNISETLTGGVRLSGEIDKYILESKVKEVMLGEYMINYYRHGWLKHRDARKDVKKLQAYRNVLEEELLQRSYEGSGCLSEEELQLLYEKIKKITANCDISPRPDLKIDNSQEEIWIARNPYCVSRERYEYLAYDVLCDLQLDVSIISNADACNITMDIARENITCDILMALSLYHTKCDLGMTVVRRDIRECKTDFNILINKTDCDISFSHYMELIEANVAPTVIETIYSNNVELSIDDGEVFLETDTEKHSIENFKSENIPTIENLQKYGVNLSTSEYLKDPENFIKKLNQDYSE